MNLGRFVILALLAYMLVDFSTPAMPGAFDFDPDKSVESVQQQRVRLSTDMIPAPDPNRYVRGQGPIRLERVEGARPGREVPTLAATVVSRLPRAALAPDAPDAH